MTQLSNSSGLGTSGVGIEIKYIPCYPINRLERLVSLFKPSILDWSSKQPGNKEARLF
jgi:hypothetical protein